METATDKYESVIGLEVHIQLLTKTKAFSSDANEYGSLPNSNVSPVSLGHPGTLPRFNKSVVEYAVRLGLACNSDIREENEFARKNYFYADLPKGYQITQDTTPICTGGHIDIKLKDGSFKKINLTRIHMEEDSGKSIHDQDPFHSLIDLNRAGVPLLEIVSEPDLRSGEEAYQYLTEVRKLVRYLDICDGNMEEGSLRCDANISIRPKGEKAFGRRVEVKNMNSIRNVQRAISHEVERQAELLEKGEIIAQETRGFDAVSGITVSQRSKEDANDYRYFPEPDLQPVMVTQEVKDQIKKSLPPLPSELFHRYTAELGLSEYDATNLVDSKPVALYFNQLIDLTSNYKAAANWVMGDIKSYLNERALSMEEFPLAPNKMASLIAMIDEGKISNSAASQKLFPALLETPDAEPLSLAEKNNWIIDSNEDSLQKFVEEAIAKYPEKVIEYKNGRTNLVGLFMGEVMKMSKGKADPKKANQMVRETLDSQP